MKNAIKLLTLACVLFVVYRGDSIIDSVGTAVPGTITEKRESIRTKYADWYRRFQIVAAFQVPGYPFARHTICDVDQQIFDGLHIGSPVTVHYLPSLLGIPMLPSTHISPCPPWGIFGSNPELYRKFLFLYGSLAVILGIVFVLRIRRVAWLLLPWSAVFVVYGVCPHPEPMPLQPRPITAVVTEVVLVNVLGKVGGRATEPITLSHPYQLVEFQYTPEGRSDPVVGLDAIDSNSVANLKVGQVLVVTYDLGNPRVASIPGATRMFREQAIEQLGLEYLILVAVFLGLFLFSRRSRQARKRTTA